MVNRSAAVGFQLGAAEYERARPSYPKAVLDALPLHDGAVVVDLAAGTGKLTRQLTAPGTTVIGIEPVAAMRAVLVAHAPTIAGVAEALPVRSSSVDVVTVAQAFHWFDAPPALGEIARVLRPGGTLLLVWNDRDIRVPWVAAMTAIIHAHDPGDAYPHLSLADRADWTGLAETVAASGRFTPLEHLEAAYPHVVTIDMIVDRAKSTSYVSAAGEEVRAQVARDVRAIVADFDEPFEHPYVTHIFTCRRT